MRRKICADKPGSFYSVRYGWAGAPNVFCRNFWGIAVLFSSFGSSYIHFSTTFTSSSTNFPQRAGGSSLVLFVMSYALWLITSRLPSGTCVRNFHNPFWPLVPPSTAGAAPCPFSPHPYYLHLQSLSHPTTSTTSR